MEIEENEENFSEENVPSESKSSESEKELEKLDEFQKEKTHFVKEMKSKHKDVRFRF